MATPLWFENPSIIYEKKYLFEIVPNRSFDFNRKLNSLLRLSIVYSLVIILFDRKKTSYLYIPFVVSVLTFLISRNYKETMVNKTTVDLMNDIHADDLEENTNKVEDLDISCRIPNKDNPFMNPNISDYNTKNDTEGSCMSYNNKGIQREIEKNFEKDLYKDVNDIFGKNSSQRQFYTVPGKSIPNDQGNFAKWLYGTMPTCKEGNGLQCAANQYGVSQGPGSGEKQVLV
jgi:hypothetical protein